MREPWLRVRRKVPESERLPDLIPPTLRTALRECSAGRAAWPLFVYGSVGVGKTSAALALCDRVDGRCVFRDFAELCGEHQDVKLGRLIQSGTHSETIVSSAEFWAGWRRAALCVVDEIGLRGNVTDHQFETLKRAIDDRHGLPLVLISNIDLDRIAGVFDDRIASRCAAGTIVRVEGADRRVRRISA